MNFLPVTFACLCVVGQVLYPRLATAADSSFDLPDCGPLARKVLDRTAGRILSIKTSEASCKVVVLIPRDGKRPLRTVFISDASAEAIKGYVVPPIPQ